MIDPVHEIPPLVHVLAFLTAGFTVYTFIEGSLFAVHVACMVVAYLLLLPEGLYAAGLAARASQKPVSPTHFYGLK